MDYEAFCSSKANDKNPNLRLIRPEQRISAKDYSSDRQFLHFLIDVRSKQEFEICHLPLAVNIPLKEIGNAKVFLETSDLPGMLEKGAVGASKYSQGRRRGLGGGGRLPSLAFLCF